MDEKKSKNAKEMDCLSSCGHGLLLKKCFLLDMHSQKSTSIFLSFIKKKYSTWNTLQETFQSVTMEKCATSETFSDNFFDF